jgi:hypothetical protein
MSLPIREPPLSFKNNFPRDLDWPAPVVETTGCSVVRTLLIKRSRLTKAHAIRESADSQTEGPRTDVLYRDVRDELSRISTLADRNLPPRWVHPKSA